MLRLSSGITPSGRVHNETPIARCNGGAWDGRYVQLIPPGSSRALSPELLHSGFQAPEGTTFEPLPTQMPNQRDVIYICGPSGAGKSTQAAAYARRFMATFKTRDSTPKLVITCPDDPSLDPAFNELPYIWISPEELVEEPVTLDMLETDGAPTLVIFDDIEGLSDKRQTAALDRFSQMVLERGRKRRIYVVYISHRPASGKVTKVVLQEQNAIMFPTCGSGSGNLSYCLEKHLSIPAELRVALKKHADEFGRWVYIRTDSLPRYVISDKKVFILDEDEVRDAVKAAKRAQSQISKQEKLPAHIAPTTSADGEVFESSDDESAPVLKEPPRPQKPRRRRGAASDA